MPELSRSSSADPYCVAVMFSMFVLWAIVFIGIFMHRRWTIPVALGAMAWTLVLLRLHMSSDLPLNF